MITVEFTLDNLQKLIEETNSHGESFCLSFHELPEAPEFGECWIEYMGEAINAYYPFDKEPSSNKLIGSMGNIHICAWESEAYFTYQVYSDLASDIAASIIAYVENIFGIQPGFICEYEIRDLG